MSRPGEPWGQQRPRNSPYGTADDVAMLVRYVRKVAAEMCRDDVQRERERLEQVKRRRAS